MPLFMITFKDHEPGIIDSETKDTAVVEATVITRCRVESVQQAPILAMNHNPPKACRSPGKCSHLDACPNGVCDEIPF